MSKIDGAEFKRSPDDVMALSVMMEEWLRGVIIDSDTGIDSGGGMGLRDLWFKMGGKEIHVCIRQK